MMMGTGIYDRAWIHKVWHNYSSAEITGLGYVETLADYPEGWRIMSKKVDSLQKVVREKIR